MIGGSEFPLQGTLIKCPLLYIDVVVLKYELKSYLNTLNVSGFMERITFDILHKADNTSHFFTKLSLSQFLFWWSFINSSINSFIHSFIFFSNICH